MTQLVITVRRFDQLARFPEIAKQEFGDTMTVAVEKLLGDAQVNSPVDRGFFRASLSPDVLKESPLKITGRISASAQHAPIIEGVDEAGNPTEFGRRPGTRYPPVSVMRAWVQRVMGIRGDDVARVAYLVSRAIVRRGIRPKRPIARAGEKNLSFIERIFNEAANRIARRIEGKG